ncbi:MAG: translation initiation factor IF-2 [Lachnospiraceae bacterium]|nr:translation initiation factor IF-2 [Lachnospiraceae bacterium]
MARMRVNELARELGVPNKDILKYLNENGHAVKSHSSSIEDAAISLVRSRFQKQSEGAAKPAESAAAKPAEKTPTENAVSKPVEKTPGENAASKLVEKSPAESAEKPAEKAPVEKAAAANNAAAKPVNKASGENAAKPVEKPSPDKAAKAKAPQKQGADRSSATVRTDRKPPLKAAQGTGTPASAPTGEGDERRKRLRPKKKNVTTVINRKYLSQQGGGGSGTERKQGEGRRREKNRRSNQEREGSRRSGFGQGMSNRIIRPRPESERTVRPKATLPKPEEELILLSTPPAEPEQIKESTEAAAQASPIAETVASGSKADQDVSEQAVSVEKTETKAEAENVPHVSDTAQSVESGGAKTQPKSESASKPQETAKGQETSRNQNAAKSQQNKGKGQNKGQGASKGQQGKGGNGFVKNQNQASSKSGGGQGQKAATGKDAGKNKKRKKDRDSLGKKQERYVNLEKKERNKRTKNQNKQPQERKSDEILTLVLPERLTIRELADKIQIAPSAIVKQLFMKGTMVTVNQTIEYEQAEEIALEYNCICEPEEKVDVIAELLKEDEEDPRTLKPRPPVVCVMGHVDHGKTSLLDAIRDTRVTAREAGGITQKIGAYVVSVDDQKITFLDTPGHEAFTAMRMRGANSTDIAILVVAADDGVMPQTVEAINHAKAANIEIIVAINKIDKPNANIDRVKQELSEYELIPSDWGGSTEFVAVSAKTQEGIDDLLEMILLTSEVLELKSNPKRNARGLVIEAELDKGRGAVATVLVQKGTLKVGDPVAAGSSFGRVRAMTNDNGENVRTAGPSMPVEIIGLSEVPKAGEIFVAMDSEKEARSFASTFVSESKNRMVEESRMKMSLDDLFTQIQAGNLKELDIIVKADVQGSVEAVRQSLEKLSNEEVVVKVIHGGVGAITESDVNLASASNAIIIGFNVRPDAIAKQRADQEGVDVRLYKVIYNAIEDVEAAMKGMLEPVFEEKIIGHAEVRQIFKSSEVGNIAGSYVTDGYFVRDCKIRIRRGEDQVYEGSLASLKRFKDDVKEVKSGYECGLVFDGFGEMEEEDIIEAYIMVEVPRDRL